MITVDATNTEPGPVYTKGNAYRARAEARQRQYRSEVLKAPFAKYGHFLSADAANSGVNFVLPEAFQAATARRDAGKGVAQRTFDNMLSSQAMCFNVFAPLQARLDLASEVLAPFIPGLSQVTGLHLEYTPHADVFRDQSGHGGVDCDLLIEGVAESGDAMVVVVETKFVEPEFSTCGFRKAGRASKGLAVCPESVPVASDREACLYTKRKGYQYWARSDQFGLLADGAVPPEGCPFGGQLWQLWVNYALAHAEAESRGAVDARFAVCTSSSNAALWRDGEVLRSFKSLLSDPDKVSFVDLEALLPRITEQVGQVEAGDGMASWAERLMRRYADI